MVIRILYNHHLQNNPELFEFLQTEQSTSESGDAESGNGESENAMNDNILKIQADSQSQLVKLPQFMPTDPKLWFDLIEIIFEAQKITEQKLKYANVIMAVEKDLILEMEEIFKGTKVECNYDELKSKILERYKKIKEDETMTALKKEQLGERKPTEFLQHLQKIAGNILPEAKLQETLIECLPEDVKVPLQELNNLEDSMPLEKLAKQADILMGFYSTIKKNEEDKKKSSNPNVPSFGGLRIN